MKKIPLEVLEAYAKKLSDTQVSMLYENKMHKNYKKALYESTPSLFKLYLNAYTIYEECETSKAEFLISLNENHSNLMKQISYKVDDDAITFSAKTPTLYSELLHALMNEGISANVIEDIRDWKNLYE